MCAELASDIVTSRDVMFGRLTSMNEIVLGRPSGEISTPKNAFKECYQLAPLIDSFRSAT